MPDPSSRYSPDLRHVQLPGLSVTLAPAYRMRPPAVLPTPRPPLRPALPTPTPRTRSYWRPPTAPLRTPLPARRPPRPSPPPPIGAYSCSHHPPHRPSYLECHQNPRLSRQATYCPSHLQVESAAAGLPVLASLRSGSPWHRKTECCGCSCLLTLVLTTALDSGGHRWTVRRLGSRSMNGYGRGRTPLGWLVMNRSSVRFRQAAPSSEAPCDLRKGPLGYQLSDQTPRQGLSAALATSPKKTIHRLSAGQQDRPDLLAVDGFRHLGAVAAEQAGDAFEWNAGVRRQGHEAVPHLPRRSVFRPQIRLARRGSEGPKYGARVAGRAHRRGGGRAVFVPRLLGCWSMAVCGRGPGCGLPAEGDADVSGGERGPGV